MLVTAAWPTQRCVLAGESLSRDCCSRPGCSWKKNLESVGLRGTAPREHRVHNVTLLVWKGNVPGPNSSLCLSHVTIHILHLPIWASVSWFIVKASCVNNSGHFSALYVHHLIAWILKIISKAWYWVSLIFESHLTTETFVFYRWMWWHSRWLKLPAISVDMSQYWTVVPAQLSVTSLFPSRQGIIIYSAGKKRVSVRKMQQRFISTCIPGFAQWHENEPVWAVCYYRASRNLTVNK